jgi:tRNA (guanine37-N1)-methyltransferase
VESGFVLRIDVQTLFPAVFEPLLAHGQIRIAREKQLLDVQLHDFRTFATDKHRSVDDKPYGGGPGMVIMCGPVYASDESIVASGRAAGLDRPRRLLLSPQGRPLDQALLEELSREPWLVLLCGHYEGCDDRIREGLGYEEVSVGDYVLSGGEVPAMILIDGVTRLIPGVLGAPDGAGSDSFSGHDRLLEGPQYTRPREFRGLKVPDILLSGDHAAVAAWRRAQARQRTRERRPDLLGRRLESDEDSSNLAGAQAHARG